MTVGRDIGGRFTGETHRGRPIGSTNRKARHALSAATLEAVQGTASEAVRQLRAKVSGGDMGAIRFVLEYCLPRGGRTIFLGSSEPNALLDAIAEGTVSPDEAARLAQAFKTTIEASEVKELTAKVEELELILGGLTKR